MIKSNMHDDVKSKERGGRVYSNGSDGEYVKEVEASNSSNSKEAEIKEKINALVLKHLSSILGEHTIKVIRYHLSKMGVDIYNWCDEPKKIEDALYSLFKESSRMLIADVVNILSTEFGITDGKWSTLDDVVKRIKVLEEHKAN